MADILNTSLTGLLAFQNALATTSHNIANVNTEGYSRQRVNLSTMPAANIGAGYIGRGVQVENVTRILDQYRVDQLRGNVAEQGRLTALNQLSADIDRLLANPDSGLSQPLQDFFSGVQTLADNPASISARQTFLSQADVLADRFGSLSARLTAQSGEVDARLGSAVTQVNALAQSVADLNLAIRDASAAAGGSAPNDLLDQRDLVLRQLSELVSVDAVTQNDGSVSVFVGSGQALVLGERANSLALVPGEYPATGAAIELVTGGSSVPLGDLNGGALGGLMDFRREVLVPSQNSLGRLAAALAQTVNAQQGQGMDLDGNLGSDLFAIGAPEVIGGVSNVGSGAISALVSDVGGLTTSDYVLRYDGVGYSLSRSDNGATVPMTGSGTGADPFVADGLSVVVGAAPAAGDSFLIRPTATAAASLSVALTDPRQLAAALPVISNAALANTGSGSISGDQILDVSDPALLDPVTIEFIDGSSYSVNGAGSFAYTAGGPIDINGWRVQIDGAPAAGDQFTVTSNAGGVGDNRNALALADQLNSGVLAGGSLSIQAGFESLVTDVSTATQRSGINLTAQTAITEQAIADQLAVSGVNLDEEAANMLRFQQSYQAIAQMISVADALFQTILSVTRQ